VTPIQARKAQVGRFIGAVPDAPAYGSEEFLGLVPETPAWIASVIRAAECWQSDCEAEAERLEVERQSRLFQAKQAEDAAFADQREAHRQAWAGDRFRPDPAIAADVEREFAEWAEGAA